MIDMLLCLLLWFELSLKNVYVPETLLWRFCNYTRNISNKINTESFFIISRSDLASCTSTESFSIWTDFYWTIDFHCTQFTCLIELKCTIWKLIRLKILADLSRNLNTIQWGYIRTLIINNVEWLGKSFIGDGAGGCSKCQTIDFYTFNTEIPDKPGGMNRLYQRKLMKRFLGCQREQFERKQSLQQFCHRHQWKP